MPDIKGTEIVRTEGSLVGAIYKVQLKDRMS